MTSAKAVITALTTAALVLLVAGIGHVDEAPAPADEPPPPTLVKGSMCVACHTATHKELVTRFKETKHGKVQLPKDMTDMKPIDIYRRTIGLAADGKTFFEAGVGCQSCHGAGSAHLAAKTDQKKATMPRVDELKTPKQKLSVCGRCHGQYTYKELPYVVNFRPGVDLFALEGFKLAEITEPGPFQQLNELEHSKHGANDITCITCHTAHEEMTGEHQLRKPVPELCLQCHTEKHPCTVAKDKIPQGATCATCHMPGGRHVFAVAAATQ